MLILAMAAAAVAHPAAKLVRWYLHYRLGRLAVARCDPDRVPDVVAAVTGYEPPPWGRPPDGDDDAGSSGQR